VRRYYEALRAALERSGARLDIYEPPAVHALDHLSAADVALYDKLFDRAESAASRDREALIRVKTARLPLMYAKLEIGKDDMFGPRGFYREKGSRFEARPAMARLLEEFAARCRAGGVRTLNESGLTPAAYTDSVQRFIDVQVEGNLAFRKPVASDPGPRRKCPQRPRSPDQRRRGAADFKVHWLGWEGATSS
jgi:hypothetical protein